jgi:hypothetical protein
VKVAFPGRTSLARAGILTLSQSHLRIRVAFWPVLSALFLLVSLYLLSIPGYVLYHSLTEIFAIVIGCAVFTLTWNTRRFLKNYYLLFVGIALLAASVVNALHTLSYKGMGVFESQDANLPTQLWIARRYLESIALLAALWFLRRKLNPFVALVAFGGITAILLGAIFRHAGRNGAVRVTIEDNGRGFAVAAALARGRLGLLGMRERAEMLGGQLEIESKPGAGTKVHVQAPVHQPA